MKTHKHLYPLITEFENLRRAFKNAARGKRGRPDVAAFEFDLAVCVDTEQPDPPAPSPRPRGRSRADRKWMRWWRSLRSQPASSRATNRADAVGERAIMPERPTSLAARIPAGVEPSARAQPTSNNDFQAAA